MRSSGFRRRLHSPGSLYMAMMGIPDPSVATILGSSGVDFVILDAEHGSFTPGSMEACAAALRDAPAAAVVRTATSKTAEIEAHVAHPLDGVLIAHVESAEATAAAIGAARGSAAIKDLAVLVTIESRSGVENIAAIAAVEGLDGIMVGPRDLSADLGAPGQWEDETLRGAIEQVVECAIGARLKVSAWREPRSPAERDSMLVYAVGDGWMLRTAARAAVDEARAAVDEARARVAPLPLPLPLP